MSADVTTLYPNEERLKDFIALYIEKVLDESELSSRSNPSVMLACTLHCFFLVLRAENITLMFASPAGRIAVTDLALVHLKLLQGLLLAYADRTAVTPPADVVADVFATLKTLSIIVIPPPSLVL